MKSILSLTLTAALLTACQPAPQGSTESSTPAAGSATTTTGSTPSATNGSQSGDCSDLTIQRYNQVFEVCSTMLTTDDGKECRTAAESFLITEPSVSCRAALMDKSAHQLKAGPIEEVISKLKSKGI